MRSLVDAVEFVSSPAGTEVRMTLRGPARLV
jgi:hypothetical protein